MKSDTGYCSNCKYCHWLLAKSCISKPVPSGYWEWRTFLRTKILNQTFANKKFMHLKVGGPITSSPHSGTCELGNNSLTANVTKKNLVSPNKHFHDNFSNK